MVPVLIVRHVTATALCLGLFASVVSVGAAQDASVPPAQPAPKSPAAPTLPTLSSARARAHVIASTEAQLADLGDPATNRHGSVVFWARRKDGREGIYSAAGAVARPIAETGGSVDDQGARYFFQEFGHSPTVNDGQLCAFTAKFENGGSAVLTSRGHSREYDFVADSGEAFAEFGDFACVGDSGSVVFYSTIDPPGHPDRDDNDPNALPLDPFQSANPGSIPPPMRFTSNGRREPKIDAGLFLDRGDELIVICDTTQRFLDLQDGIAANESGMIAFRASLRPKKWSLLLDNGGAMPVTLAETGARFKSIGLPALNGRGRAAFVAESVTGGAVVCRGFKGSGLPEVLASAANGFTAIGPNVSIDDTNRVAFVGRGPDGKDALYVASDAKSVEPLLASGDAIGTARVKRLRLGNRCFASPGRLVALVELEPPGEAIVQLEISGR